MDGVFHQLRLEVGGPSQRRKVLSGSIVCSSRAREIHLHLQEGHVHETGTEAEVYFAKWRRAAPATKIGVCLFPPAKTKRCSRPWEVRRKKMAEIPQTRVNTSPRSFANDHDKPYPLGNLSRRRLDLFFEDFATIMDNEYTRPARKSSPSLSLARRYPSLGSESGSLAV